MLQRILALEENFSNCDPGRMAFRRSGQFQRDQPARGQFRDHHAVALPHSMFSLKYGYFLAESVRGVKPKLGEVISQTSAP
jgi:hypothetical protein